MNNDGEFPDLLKLLSDGYSLQNKIATGFWIFMATFSVFVFLPHSPNDTINILFFNINYESFYPFSYIVLSLVIICYGSITAQSIRSRNLIQKLIDKHKNKYIDSIHIQDAFDSIIFSTLYRVSPLAQILQGREEQFYPKSKNSPIIIRAFAALYFIILKLLTIIFMEILPGYALIYSFNKGKIINLKASSLQIPNLLLILCGVVSIIVIYELIVLNIAFCFRVIKQFLRIRDLRILFYEVIISDSLEKTVPKIINTVFRVIRYNPKT